MRFASVYDVVRIVLAGVLLLAAGLKGYQLATEPVLGTDLLDSAWLLIAVVEFEIFFGLWLLANIWPEWTRRAAVLCFGVFATVSLYKALSGAASCGCFGRAEVNPWYTFTLDVAIVVALLRWGPLCVVSSPENSRRASVSWETGLVAAWLAIGIPVAIMIGKYQHSVSTGEGMILGQNELVILEPEKWTAQQFPLLPFIEEVPGQVKPNKRHLRQRLAEKEWIVVLYHPNCRTCQRAIPKYKELAREWAEDARRPRVALIEVPTYKTTPSQRLSRNIPWVLGRLSARKEWFVETPVLLLLRDGLTIVVKDNEGLEDNWLESNGIRPIWNNHPGHNHG